MGISCNVCLFFSCGALVWIGAISSLLSLFLSYHFNNCAFNYSEIDFEPFVIVLVCRAGLRCKTAASFFSFLS